jgi:hypothetical protein
MPTPDDPWQRGYDAYYSGAQCPYPAGSRDAYEWQCGQEDAAENDFQEDE